MTPNDRARLARVIEQAFLDDYPPELAPWNVTGRKNWRKEHLFELIEKEFDQTEEASNGKAKKDQASSIN